MISKNIIEAFIQVAKEKNIDRKELAGIIKEIFMTLIQKKYGNVDNFDVIVNMDKGEIEIYQEKEVVETVFDSDFEVDLETAHQVAPDLEIGDPYIDVVDPDSFGRRLITYARQTLNQKIQEFEKEEIYTDYAGRVNEIILGEIHQIRRDALFINIDKAELKMPRDEQIYNERYRRGDSVRAIIKEVRKDKKNYEIIISRADPAFLIKLFKTEVPEIEDGIIEIRAIAREPGDRTKIIVESNDKRIDAVGACVGMKGSRIQVIVRELNGEKIDIINFSSETKLLIQRALSPAKPYHVEIDYVDRRALALFEDSDISVAIGKNGQNVRLASKVTGFEIDAKSRSEVEGGSEEEIFLVDVEGLPTRVVNILVENGIETVNEVVNTSRESLLNIKGLGEKGLDEFMEVLNEAVEIEEVVEEVEVDVPNEDEANPEEADNTESLEESKEV
ncbi:MAG: transcription termination factor NusA [Candidatus Marinimicrobia bacterium]|nr:transcription termination factor NusA [Candidatus Neomarinimicrobiota bacterium]MCF7839726.1 transcription termination factor NusA [Candidatus Neomarinimicrobiota bacterium]MCF7903229.1 transcription termination factor NusA [Candidatus Neomarinimicrobiota bacterium]